MLSTSLANSSYPFNDFFNLASANSQMDANANRQDDYWGAYLLWAFQFDARDDYDSNNEFSFLTPTLQDQLGSGRGYTDSVGGQWSGAAVESARDSFLNGPYAGSWAGWGYAFWSDLLWRTAAHEVGHQFGLTHVNGWLMGGAEGSAAQRQHFAPADIVLIRTRPQSPGR
jgi:hypothetical protein